MDRGSKRGPLDPGGGVRASGVAFPVLLTVLGIVLRKIISSAQRRERGQDIKAPVERERVANHFSDDGVAYETHKELVQLNGKTKQTKTKQKTSNAARKCAEDLNRHLSKEHMRTANRYVKRCSTPLVIRQMRTQSTARSPLTPSERLSSRSRPTATAAEHVDKGDPRGLVVGLRTGAATTESSLEDPRKVKIGLPTTRSAAAGYSSEDARNATSKGRACARVPCGRS